MQGCDTYFYIRVLKVLNYLKDFNVVIAGRNMPLEIAINLLPICGRYRFLLYLCIIFYFKSTENVGRKYYKACNDFAIQRDEGAWGENIHAHVL